MLLKIFCFALILIFEIPLAIKCRKAIKEYDFSRQAAIALLMIVAALFVALLYKFGLFVLGLV